MHEEKPLELDETFVGEGLVDEDAVAAFASAVNDFNPRYQEGRATPLLFTTGLVLDQYHASHSAWMDAADVRGFSVSAHGEHDVRYLRPVVPGTRCRWAVSSRSALETKGGVILTASARITDMDGDLLVEHLWSTFFKGGTVSAQAGPPLPDHTLAEEAGKSPIHSRELTIDRDQGFRYAGASGDRTAHAIDDDRARLEGYPGKILQGLCTFSMACGVLVDLLADGDPDRVTRVAVRFSAPTRPSRGLTVDVFDVRATGEAFKAFAFEATQEGVRVLRHGRLELRG